MVGRRGDKFCINLEGLEEGGLGLKSGLNISHSLLFRAGVDGVIYLIHSVNIIIFGSSNFFISN